MKTKKTTQSPPDPAWSGPCLPFNQHHPPWPFRKHLLARAWTVPSAWNAPFPPFQILAQASFPQESHSPPGQGAGPQLSEHCASCLFNTYPCLQLHIYSCHYLILSGSSTFSLLAEQSQPTKLWTLLEPGATVFSLFHSVLPIKKDKFFLSLHSFAQRPTFPPQKPHQACSVVCWVCLILKFKIYLQDNKKHEHC